MSKFKITKAPIEGIYIIEPSVFTDERGFFLESYSRKEFQTIGINEKFVQDNHSRSIGGVLRGLHFQTRFPQAKLIRVIRGAVFDVAVDLRRDSPTFQKYFSITLSEENRKILYLPKGFAHGFLTLTSSVDVIYKVSNHYYPEYDSGIIWNDPEIKIQWPFKQYGITEPLVSIKDANLPKLNEVDFSFDYSNKSQSEYKLN